MSLKSDVIAGNGEVSAERLLLEVARRFAESNEFNLTPKRASQVIASVLNDVNEGRVAYELRKAEAGVDVG